MMIRRTKFSKWPLFFLIIVLILTALTYAFFRWHIDQMLGGNTEVIDTSEITAISGAIAISNTNILSPDSQMMRENQTVLIEGDKISFVGRVIDIPTHYHIIDGQNKFVIPGLIDSHVHIKKSINDLLLYVANGVTQVGEMTGMEHHFDIAAQIENGTIGPALFIASPKITSRTGLRPLFRSMFEKRHQNYLTPEQGRNAVKRYKSLGYSAIKLSSDLDSDIYYAINDEAEKLNIPVIGHLPVGLQLADLYRSGQSQLAHIDSIVLSLIGEFDKHYASSSEEFLAYVQQQSDTIASRFKEHEIVLASTVWLHKTRLQQGVDLPAFLRSIEFEYQNPGWVEGSFVSKGCLPGSNSYQQKNTTENDVLFLKKAFKTYNEAIAIVTRALSKKGVSITAGTDSLGACGMIAGFALHKELESLSQIGLTNAQVLYAATVAPAHWMKVRTGKIKLGYRADLLILDKNPLEDIRHTRNISGVVVKGKYLDRNKLDEMLHAVKQANANSRTRDISAYITKH